MLRFARAAKPCPGCANIRVLAFYDEQHRPACARCTGNPPVYACRACGREDSQWGIRCAPCVLAERATALLSQPGGGIHPQLQPVYDALLAGRSSASGQPPSPAAASSAGNGRRSRPPSPNGRITTTPETEIRGERQDPLLGLAFARVERHLDRVDAAGSHDPLEHVERAGLEGRRAEPADVADATLALHPVEVLAPGEEVVDLEQVDPPGVPAELSREMAAAVGDRARPDLGRDERIASALAERRRQDGLRPAVHRRAVDDRRAGVERGRHHRVGRGLAGGRQVEHPPGAEADDREVDAGPSERSRVHRGHRSGTASRQSSSGRAGRRGSARSLGSRLRCGCNALGTRAQAR